MTDRIIQQRGGRLAAVVSTILVLFSVGGVFSELQQAMNRIWKLKARPGAAVMTFVRARAKSILVMGVAAILLVGSVVVTAWLGNITTRLGLTWKYVSWAIDLVVSVWVLTLLFALLYKTIPDGEIEWRPTLKGALISAILFTLGKYGLALYFKLAAPASAFGAAGSLAAILIWIYYSAQIMFFGAEFTQVYAKARGLGVRPSKHAQFLSTCDETETATPSSEPPGLKPSRPGVQRDSLAAANYGTVLGRNVKVQNVATGSDEHFVPRRTIREYTLAGASLVLGVLVGGYSAKRITRPGSAARQQRFEGGINEQIKHIDAKLRHVARAGRFLHQRDINEQLDALQDQIRRIERNTERPAVAGRGTRWAETAMRAVRSCL